MVGFRSLIATLFGWSSVDFYFAQWLGFGSSACILGSNSWRAARSDRAQLAGEREMRTAGFWWWQAGLGMWGFGVSGEVFVGGLRVWSGWVWGFGAGILVAGAMGLWRGFGVGWMGGCGMGWAVSVGLY